MTEEAPLTPPIDESQRIEDPEKAHVMALAGNDERSQAANYRMAANRYEELNKENPIQEGTDPDGSLQAQRDQRIEGLRSEADASDAVASIQEDRAGNQYEVEKNYVQDPEKAHAMALAGDRERSTAAGLRLNTEQSRGRDVGIQHHEMTADVFEEEAARQYDAEHPANSPETGGSSKEVEELVNLYRDLVTHDPDSPYLAYFRNNIIHNTQYAIDNPEKAKEIYTRLAASDKEALRLEAVFQFVSMLSIDKTLALDTMHQLISNVETIETISETLDSLVNQDGSLKEEARSLSPNEVKLLLRAYADRLVQTQE
jgi:hypothetical protein